MGFGIFRTATAVWGIWNFHAASAVGGLFNVHLHRGRLLPAPKSCHVSAVGGLFIPNLHDEARHFPSPNPTNAVGGLFIPDLHDEARHSPSPNPTNAIPTYIRALMFLLNTPNEVGGSFNSNLAPFDHEPTPSSA